VYIVRQDAAGDSWVQFGDGETGARLPSGVGNVTAVPRSGHGAYGPLVDGTKVEPGGQASRLDRIELPGVISGGQQPEPADNARRAAPGRVQALNRLVSLRDFEAETVAIAGVWAAAAAWQLVDNIPTVVLTVLMQTGRDAEIDQVRQVLATANRCRGPQRFAVVVRQGSLRHVYLDLTAAIDGTLRTDTMASAIKAALGATGEEGNGVDGSAGLFATGKRTFGQREYATRVEAVAQQVPGVRWASVNALGPLAGPPGPPTLALPAGPWPLVPVVPCGADQILTLHTAHLHLSVSAAAAAECT
jgi:hypothetical protein